MSTHGSLSEVELFNLLYKSSFNKVCNFACFYVRNKQVSEDITMDAFLQLLETMKVESVDNPMALLITIVKHKSLVISKHKYDEKIPRMILYNGNSTNWLSESQTWKAVTPAIFSHRKSNLS